MAAGDLPVPSLELGKLSLGRIKRCTSPISHGQEVEGKTQDENTPYAPPVQQPNANLPRLSYTAVLQGKNQVNREASPNLTSTQSTANFQFEIDAGTEAAPRQPISHFQGKKAVLFPIEDKSVLVDKHKYVLIGKFSHGRPSWLKIKDFFTALKLIGFYNISTFDRKHIYIECSNRIDFNRIWLRLQWFIDGCAMRILKWVPDFSPAIESPIVPVWIRMEGIPLYMYEELPLWQIANVVGKPIRIDSRNLNRTMLNTARICVELDISKPVIESFVVCFEDKTAGVVKDHFNVEVFYDNIPHYCSSCYHVGHNMEHCKRSPPIHEQKRGKEAKINKTWTVVKSGTYMGKGKDGASSSNMVNDKESELVAQIDVQLKSVHLREVGNGQNEEHLNETVGNSVRNEIADHTAVQQAAEAVALDPTAQDAAGQFVAERTDAPAQVLQSQTRQEQAGQFVAERTDAPTQVLQAPMQYASQTRQEQAGQIASGTDAPAQVPVLQAPSQTATPVAPQQLLVEEQKQVGNEETRLTAATQVVSTHVLSIAALEDSSQQAVSPQNSVEEAREHTRFVASKGPRKGLMIEEAAAPLIIEIDVNNSNETSLKQDPSASVWVQKDGKNECTALVAWTSATETDQAQSQLQESQVIGKLSWADQVELEQDQVTTNSRRINHYMPLEHTFELHSKREEGLFGNFFCASIPEFYDLSPQEQKDEAAYIMAEFYQYFVRIALEEEIERDSKTTTPDPEQSEQEWQTVTSKKKRTTKVKADQKGYQSRQMVDTRTESLRARINKMKRDCPAKRKLLAELEDLNQLHFEDGA